MWCENFLAMNVQKKMPNLTERDKLKFYLVNNHMYFKSDTGFLEYKQNKYLVMSTNL